MKLEIEEIEEIIKMIKSGIKIRDIAKKFFASEKTIRNALYEYGYRYNKRLELWVNKDIHEEGIYIMQNCDIELEIEEISKVRYYDRYKELYPDGIHTEEKKQIKIHKGLFKEIEQLSVDYGADWAEELIELILLRFLEKNRIKDLTVEFRERFLLEDGFDENEVKILMKYDDDDDVSAAATELFWEDDSYPEAKELKEFYKTELKKNNINLSDMNEKIKVNVRNDKRDFLNEFQYLKEKYDHMKKERKG